VTGPGIPERARNRGAGMKVIPVASPAMSALMDAGRNVVIASGPSQTGYMTSRKVTVAPNTALQVVSQLEPENQMINFRLWMQDRQGSWFRMGNTMSVDGQVVLPVIEFTEPGTYQLVATSVRGESAVDENGLPVWGSTTVRTIVIVTPREEMGTKMCPNMISFDRRSAVLSKKAKRQIRDLAECLGAMPAIRVTGYVAQAVRPKAAKRMAYLRARNVRNYLRDLGYDGKAPVKRTIVRRPAACKPTNNRCAIVRLDLGKQTTAERAALDEQASAAGAPEGSAPAAGESVESAGDAAPGSAPSHDAEPRGSP